ncbi:MULTISPECIES: hypothetical protein [Fischerella]|uniref:hypothetical protein n=1 Tax=Fischerella TaxID=1190 RepID=UPI0002EF98D2|nr:hypothetical protein [Fischerella muscicola]
MDVCSRVLPINLLFAINKNRSTFGETSFAKSYFLRLTPQSGLIAKRHLKEVFDWNEFKERFASDFGKLEEKRYSLEQLLEYANRKLGKTLDDLIVQNQISWQRRQEYAERINANLLPQISEESEC